MSFQIQFNEAHSALSYSVVRAGLSDLPWVSVDDATEVAVALKLSPVVGGC